MYRSKKVLYFILAALSVLLIAVVCRFLFIVESPLLDHVKFKEIVNGLAVNPYYDETENIYYLFIPSYVDKEDIIIDSSDFVGVSFSDETTKLGKDLKNVPLSDNVVLTLTNFYKKENYSFQILQCEDVPTVYIETETGTMDDVNADINYEEDASVVIMNADGQLQFSGMSSITGRGNSTWAKAKNPYNLKFDEMTNLIGDENATTWCLLANYSDESKIRNALSYYTARELGIDYTSDIHFISLFINGDYYGLYNVATKQNYKENEDICAVFEQSRDDKAYDYITDSGSYIRFRYGDEDYVKNVVNSFETIIFDEEISYSEIENVIDVSSFARKYLVEYFTRNQDSSLSQYFSIDSEGKISAICAWDYDLTFGVSWNQYFDFNYNCISSSNRWYNALFKHEEFKEEVISIFEQNYEDLQTSLFDYMDQCCLFIENDWTNDTIRWANSEPFSSGRCLLKSKDFDFDTLGGNQEYIRDFVQKRTAFLLDYWNYPGSYYKITFSDDTIGSNTVYCKQNSALTADMLPDGILTIPLDGFLGWFTEDGISIEEVETVTENMTFYGAWENTEEDTEENT